MGVGTVIVVGGAASAVLITLRFLTSDLRAKRSLRKLARARIADVREGDLVKISGTIGRLGDGLVSPNRSASCVYYHAWYEELQRGTKGGVGWVAIGDEQHGCDFAIEDDSGIARVEGDGMVGALDPASYEAFDAASDGQRGREAIIAVGQRVAVIGRATFEAVAGGDTAGYRDGARRLVIRANGESPVIISDERAIAD